MLSSINSATFSSPAGAKPSVAGLEAQLERYRKELSNCVNCSSSKTPEGKEKIQSISGKISTLQSRIEEITRTKAATESTELNPGTPTTQIASQGASSSGTLYNSAATISESSSVTSSIGNRLDVFA